jgi:aminoglycoside phosphotransferase family enzyme
MKSREPCFLKLIFIELYDDRMDNLLHFRRIDIKIMDLLTEKIVAFHRLACTNDTIANFGRPHIIKSKIRENLQLSLKLQK